MSFHNLRYLSAAKRWAAVACLFMLGLNFSLSAQTRYTIPNEMLSDKCTKCQNLFHSKPKEVLCGISIETDGTVVFSMNSLDWFNKIFKGARDGIAVDLVTKDQYTCGSKPMKEGYPKGIFLKPMYLNELKKNMVLSGGGHLIVKMGNIPTALQGKEVEGNLTIIRDGAICHYTNFFDIERSYWNLLPMGLFADTLMQGKPTRDMENPLLYSHEMQITIPFGRNKAAFDSTGLDALRKVMKSNNAHIVKMEIRAYSSVEGAGATNEVLQKKRAASVIKSLQQYQPTPIQSEITTSENWVEFYNDVIDTPFDELSYLSREEVKKRLTNPKLLSRIEPILSKHRKAVMTVLLDKNTGMEHIEDTALLQRFKQAVGNRDVQQASHLQDEIFSRIAAELLPPTCIDRLEIPEEKHFLFLLISREAYLNLMGIREDIAAVNAFKKLLLLDAGNGRIRYNICALTCNIWRFDTSFTSPQKLLADINSLAGYGIDKKLVKRMLVNYYILMSEWYMNRGEYDKKDVAVDSVVNHYTALQLNDKELLSLAKYLCVYSQMGQADSLLAPRVSSIDVSENLLFYYLNLKLFDPEFWETEEFEGIVLNAVSINRKRFCKLFSSLNNGGVSFQLLEYDVLKDMYCEYCKP